MPSSSDHDATTPAPPSHAQASPAPDAPAPDAPDTARLEELGRDPFLTDLQDTCAEFFEGFGFKANLGRIWMTLYYSVEPLSQKELMQLLQLSAGMVSQGLNELHRFGLVFTSRVPERRETLYSTERNLAKAVASLLGHREDQLIQRSIQRIEAIKQNMAVSQPHSPDTSKRLQALEELLVILELARAVIAIFESFSRYTYHAMKLGIRALTRLRVSDLPQWLQRKRDTGSAPTDDE